MACMPTYVLWTYNFLKKKTEYHGVGSWMLEYKSKSLRGRCSSTLWWQHLMQVSGTPQVPSALVSVTYRGHLRVTEALLCPENFPLLGCQKHLSSYQPHIYASTSCFTWVTTLMQRPMFSQTIYGKQLWIWTCLSCPKTLTSSFHISRIIFQMYFKQDSFLKSKVSFNSWVW